MVAVVEVKEERACVYQHNNSGCVPRSDETREFWGVVIDKWLHAEEREKQTDSKLADES